MDWKKGVTRLYIVGWAFWLLVLAFRSFFTVAGANPVDMPIALAGFAFFGVVLPAGLLWGFRWALDGFTPSGRGG
jgi:hypothetical protein